MLCFLFPGCFMCQQQMSSDKVHGYSELLNSWWYATLRYSLNQVFRVEQFRTFCLLGTDGADDRGDLPLQPLRIFRLRPSMRAF